MITITSEVKYYLFKKVLCCKASYDDVSVQLVIHSESICCNNGGVEISRAENTYRCCLLLRYGGN